MFGELATWEVMKARQAEMLREAEARRLLQSVSRAPRNEADRFGLGAMVRRWSQAAQGKHATRRAEAEAKAADAGLAGINGEFC